MAEPCPLAELVPVPGELVDHRQWYAVYVTPRHEKRVTTRLEEKCLPVFLPLFRAVHRWSDRRKCVELPLFPGYTFVRLSVRQEDRVAVLRTSGVLRFVGAAPSLGTPIPAKQIEDIWVLVNSRLPLEPHPFLKVGDRVRIRSGSLAGVEGILSGKNSDATLVITIDLLQRSVAVRIHGFDVESLGTSYPANSNPSSYRLVH